MADCLARRQVCVAHVEVAFAQVQVGFWRMPDCFPRRQLRLCRMRVCRGCTGVSNKGGPRASNARPPASKGRRGADNGQPIAIKRTPPSFNAGPKRFNARPPSFNAGPRRFSARPLRSTPAQDASAPAPLRSTPAQDASAPPPSFNAGPRRSAPAPLRSTPAQDASAHRPPSFNAGPRRSKIRRGGNSRRRQANEKGPAKGENRPYKRTSKAARPRQLTIVARRIKLGLVVVACRLPQRERSAFVSAYSSDTGVARGSWREGRISGFADTGSARITWCGSNEY